MKRNKRLLQVWLGIGAANLLGVVVSGLLFAIVPRSDDVWISATFIILPMLMGFVAAWCWRKLQLGHALRLGNTALIMLISFFFAWLLFQEGAFCLIILSPLYYAALITGVYIGHAIFKQNNNRMNISLVSLLLVLGVADLLSAHSFETAVADEIIINAPPARVWPHVVAFPQIEQPPRWWFFKIGLPKPIATTVEARAEGAGRKCIFDNGLVFEEKMVVYQPGRNLTFDIVEQPQDPELLGHIDILRGQFLLTDNGDGTTTLTGTSWYRLHTFPAWYFNMWASGITRNVHLRVMEHIKELSEQEPAAGLSTTQ